MIHAGLDYSTITRDRLEAVLAVTSGIDVYMMPLDANFVILDMATWNKLSDTALSALEQATGNPSAEDVGLKVLDHPDAEGTVAQVDRSRREFHRGRKPRSDRRSKPRSDAHEVIAELHAQGVDTSGIVDELGLRGLKTLRGNDFSYGTVYEVVRKIKERTP